MSLFRWTAFAFLFPKQYVKSEYSFSAFDVEEFNSQFNWRSDGWGGLKDTVQDPWNTRRSAAGDCEDYALLIASYLLSETEEDVSLVFLARGRTFHAVCSTGDAVYSSGEVHEGTLDEYCEEAGYTAIFARTVR
jgi:hypothetical protein